MHTAAVVMDSYAAAMVEEGLTTESSTVHQLSLLSSCSFFLFFLSLAVLFLCSAHSGWLWIMGAPVAKRRAQPLFSLSAAACTLVCDMHACPSLMRLSRQRQMNWKPTGSAAALQHSCREVGNVCVCVLVHVCVWKWERAREAKGRAWEDLICVWSKHAPFYPPPLPPSTFSGDTGTTIYTVVKVGLSVLIWSWSAFTKPGFLCERKKKINHVCMWET